MPSAALSLDSRLMIPALLSIILYCASHPTPKAALIKIFLGGGCAGTGIVLLYLTARVEVRCTAIADVSGMCVWTQDTGHYFRVATATAMYSGLAGGSGLLVLGILGTGTAININILCFS